MSFINPISYFLAFIMEPLRKRTLNLQDDTRTRCRWCRKSYSSAGTYANHVQAKHPECSPALFEARTPTQLSWETPPKPPLLLAGAQNIPTLGEVSSTNLDHEPVISIDSDHELLDDEIEDIEDIAPSADENNSPADDELFPSYMRAGASVASIQVPRRDEDLYFPFKSSLGYKLARFFVHSRTPKSMVADYFKDGLAPAPTMEIGFKSGHTLHKLLDEMVQTPPWDRGEVDFALQKGMEFYLRDIIPCIQYLVSQPAFSNHVVWEPIHAKAYDGSRVYSELNTGDWWWEKQVTCIPSVYPSADAHDPIAYAATWIDFDTCHSCI